MCSLRFVPSVLPFVLVMALAAQSEPAAKPAPPDALAVARTLGKDRYAGWTYGAGEAAAKKQIDCTCFLAAVCTELAKQSGKTLDATTLAGIKVAISDEDKKNEQELVEDDDEKIQGVASALVTAKLGTKVEPKEAQAGDLVQYWYKKDGRWHGHASVIESVEKGKATLFGSHMTTLKTRADGDTKIDTKLGGIGTGPSVPLTGKSYKLFVVRWSAPKTAEPAPGAKK